MVELEPLEHVDEANIAEAIYEFFRERNFHVIRNAEVKDINGITHTFDVLAEGELMPGIPLRIGVIVHTRPLTIDDVEWFIAKKVVIPNLDKLIIVTLEEVEHRISEVLSRYGISVIRLSEYLKLIKKGIGIGLSLKMPKYVIVPKAECGNVFKLLEKTHKHHFFGRRKCRVEGFVLVYVPIIRLLSRLTIEDVSSGKVSIREVSFLVDGIKGYVLTVKGSSLTIDEVIGMITDLPINALEVLSIISRKGIAQVSDIAAELGIDVSRVKNLLDALSLRSLIDVYGDLAEIRYKVFDELKDILEVISKEYVISYEKIPNELFRKALFVTIRIPLYKLIDLVKSLNGELIGISIIFYPLYVALCMTNKHEERLLVIDGLSGQEHEELARIIDSPEITKSIMNSMKELSMDYCKEIEELIGKLRS